MGCQDSKDHKSVNGNLRIIVVTGATGNQGGSLIDALLQAPYNKQCKVRAVTRKKDSDKAKALEAKGIEVVEANFDDVETLKTAFHGAYGAYLATNFWELFSAEKEIKQGKNLVDAAKFCNIKHVVWSALDDTRQALKGKAKNLEGEMPVPHFDGKAEIQKYIVQSKIPNTNLFLSFFYENYISFGMGPKKIGDNKYAIMMNMGDKPLPMVAIRDIGLAAAKIFSDPKEYIGKDIGLSSVQLTGAQIAQAFAKTFNKDITYIALEDEKARKAGYKGAEEMANMFQFYVEDNDHFCKLRDVKRSNDIVGGVYKFEKWLEDNKSKIEIKEN